MMHRLPIKVSLVAQTASILREGIDAGRWVGWLPGEHALAAQLHVGRKTIRTALERLRREGLVRCKSGFRREIVRHATLSNTPGGTRVVLLVPEPLQSLNPFVVFLIDRLREHLAEEGYQLETHANRAVYRARRPQAIDSLARTLHPAGWVLLHSTEPMQRWFAARQLPCVVVGSRFEAVELPSVDLDYNAVCLHAVNQFVARGHKELVLLNPQPGGAGDARTKAGFLEAVSAKAATGVHGTLVEHDSTPAGICARVDSLMSRPNRPSAFLVSRARHFLSVLVRLLSSGVAVPGQVALISREHDTYLDAIVPTVARYSQNPKVFAANASRLVMDMVRGTRRLEDYRIMPKFIRGQTLG